MRQRKNGKQCVLNREREREREREKEREIESERERKSEIKKFVVVLQTLPL